MKDIPVILVGGFAAIRSMSGNEPATMKAIVAHEIPARQKEGPVLE